MPVVVHHKQWVYLADWLGLNIVASLEPKPGIPPSASHLETLLAILKQTPAQVIIHSPYEDSSPTNWLSKKAGIPAIVLPYTVGGDNASQTLETLFDRTVQLLLQTSTTNGKS